MSTLSLIYTHTHPHTYGSNRILFRKQSKKNIIKENSSDPLSKSCRKPKFWEKKTLRVFIRPQSHREYAWIKKESLKFCRIIIDTLQRNRLNSTHFNTHTHIQKTHIWAIRDTQQRRMMQQQRGASNGFIKSSKANVWKYACNVNFLFCCWVASKKKLIPMEIRP